MSAFDAKILSARIQMSAAMQRLHFGEAAVILLVDWHSALSVGPVSECVATGELRGTQKHSVSRLRHSATRTRTQHTSILKDTHRDRVTERRRIAERSRSRAERREQQGICNVEYGIVNAL